MTKTQPEFSIATGYIYQPLSASGDEIRILDLLPGAKNDPIRVRMRTISFPTTAAKGVASSDEESPSSGEESPSSGEESPSSGEESSSSDEKSPILEPYEALSYTWGANQRTSISIVNGTGHQILDVTYNCAEALTYLRLAEEPRSLWVDAICINQGTSNTALRERSQQVHMMAQIFRRASRVVAWLGLSSESANIAFDWILDERPDHGLIPTDTVISASSFDALIDLILRPWFARLWIWQEICLGSSRSVLKCGDRELLWTAFKASVDSIVKPGKKIPDVDRPLEETLNRLTFVFRASKLMHETIISRLHIMSICKCMDPRDRIYTAQNMNNRGEKYEVIPDYTLPWQSCYTALILSYIEQTGRLDFLQYVSLRAGSLDEIPSWVPNWSIQPPEPYRLYFNANARSASAILHMDMKRLCAKGALITHLSSEMTEKQYPFGSGNHYQLLHLLKAAAGRSGDTDSIVSLCRALLGELSGQKISSRHPDPLGLASCVEVAQRVLNQEFVGRSEEEVADEDKRVIIFLTTALRDGCCVFRAHDGRFVVTRHKARPGDAVAVLLGCEAPLILRPTSDACYQVVGEASCTGLMDGEALLGDLPLAWEATRYMLSGPSFWAFRHCETGLVQFKDPRLPDTLPPGWIDITDEKTPHLYMLSNENTGERRYIGAEFLGADPRCDFEELEKRGVILTDFNLV